MKTTFNHTTALEYTRINVNIFMDFLVDFFLHTPDFLQMLDHKQHCILLFTKGVHFSMSLNIQNCDYSIYVLISHIYTDLYIY